jgi:hypothetical protein
VDHRVALGQAGHDASQPFAQRVFSEIMLAAVFQDDLLTVGGQLEQFGLHALPACLIIQASRQNDQR